MRKIALLIIILLLITIVFLGGVFILNNQNGKGALQVTSKPSSQVFLDGKLVGKTPLCLCELPKLIKSGEYDIKLVPTGGDLKEFQQRIIIYQEVMTVVDRTFESEAGASSASVITLSPINGKTSQLLVISSPQNSKVVLDSNLAGLTPLLIKNVTASDHEVKILKDGYNEKVIKVKTVEGKKLEVSIVLGIKKDINSKTSASSSAKTITILETPVGYLRVRQEASVDSPQIATVNPGEELQLLEEKDDWYKVKLDSGKVGWVSSSYATKD